MARFYGIAPDLITEEQLREYLLHLTNVKKVAASTFTLALCGIKFFYEQTLAVTGPCSSWRARSAPTGSPSC